MISPAAELQLIRAAYAFQDPAKCALDFLRELQATDTSGWTEDQKFKLARAIEFNHGWLS